MTSALPESLDTWDALWRDHASPFLRALGGDADLPFCFQVVDDPKTGVVRPRHVTLPLIRARVDLIDAQRHGGGVFVTVNETDGKGRRKENITRVRAIWADIDAPNGVTLVDGGLTLMFSDGVQVPLRLPASMVVKTRKGLHLYWLCEAGIDAATAEDLLWWAHVWNRGDRAVCEVARVLRLPGCYHLKKDPPFLVTLEQCEPDRVYSLAELHAAFPAVPGRERPPPPVAVGPAPGTVTEDEAAWALTRAREYLAQRPGAVEGGGGDAHTFETCARVADWVGDEAAALALLEEWNARACVPPWAAEDLQKKWAHATRYRQSPVGSEVALERHAAGIREWMAPVLQLVPAPTPVPPPPPGVTAPGPAEAPGVYLVKDEKGVPKSVGSNYVSILAHSDQWRGCFRYNLFRKAPEVCRPMPLEPGFCPPEPYTGPLRGDDAVAAAHWIQRNWNLKAPTPQVQEAIRAAAVMDTFHPVVDYLRRLQWDGVARVDTWLERYCAAVISDSHRPRLAEYVRMVGRFWLISAVARVMRHKTGAKVDTMLILEGLQGLGKSEVFRILAVQPVWHSESRLDIHAKDTLQNMQGKWIWELAELEALARSDAGAIRAFLTVQSDFFRAPYAAAPEDHPRQTVFCGTTNDSQYLRDPTGGRRFWPVRCDGPPDLVALRADVHQLWAEAVALHAAPGARWWYDFDLRSVFETEEQERQQSDPWEEPLRAWIRKAGLTHTTVSDAYTEGAEVPVRDQNRQGSERIQGVLRRLGWTPCRMPGNTMKKGWAAPAAIDLTAFIR